MVTGLPGMGKTQCCEDLAALGLDFGLVAPELDYEDPTAFSVARIAMRAMGVRDLRDQTLLFPGSGSANPTYLAHIFILEGFGLIPPLPQAFKNPCPGSAETLLSLYPTITRVIVCQRDWTPWVTLMLLYGIGEEQLRWSYHQMLVIHPRFSNYRSRTVKTMRYNVDWRNQHQEEQCKLLKDFISQ